MKDVDMFLNIGFHAYIIETSILLHDIHLKS